MGPVLPLLTALGSGSESRACLEQRFRLLGLVSLRRLLNRLDAFNVSLHVLAQGCLDVPADCSVPVQVGRLAAALVRVCSN